MPTPMVGAVTTGRPRRRRRSKARSRRRARTRAPRGRPIRGPCPSPPTRSTAGLRVRSDRAPAVEAALGVLDVDMVDAVGELLGEGGGVEELWREMTGVEVDPEALAAVDRGQRPAR